MSVCLMQTSSKLLKLLYSLTLGAMAAGLVLAEAVVCWQERCSITYLGISESLQKL